jgi:hypothetical protein
MKRPLCLALLLCAAPALAGGPAVIAPPTINIQPRAPVLDQQCVDKLKGTGASTARAAHECRKAYNPGTPPPQALRDKNQTPPAPKP